MRFFVITFRRNGDHKIDSPVVSTTLIGFFTVIDQKISKPATFVSINPKTIIDHAFERIARLFLLKCVGIFRAKS